MLLTIVEFDYLLIEFVKLVSSNGQRFIVSVVQRRQLPARIVNLHVFQ